MNAIILALSTVVCGWGQLPYIDEYGNSICRDVQTGQVRAIDGDTSRCPTGTLSRLTPQGPACVSADGSARYFDDRGPCPIGTYPGIDYKGNRACLAH